MPTAAAGPAEWRYTTTEPAAGWHAEGFDAARWDQGKSGFGTNGTPGAIVRTEWKTKDLWLRRAFTLEALPEGRVQLLIHHDEDAEVWINGVLAARLRGYTRDYERAAILPAAGKALRAGVNTLAVHCRQTTGGQYIDVGLVTVDRAR